MVKGDSKPNEAQERTFLIRLFVFLLCDLLSFTVILPLLPSILDKYKASDASGLYAALESSSQSFRRQLQVPSEMEEKVESVFIGGIIGSLFSLLQFLASPLIGALSDKFGRKPLLLFTISGSLLSYILWIVVAESFLGFVIARILLGLSRGNVNVCSSMVSDMTSSKRRTKGMMVVGLAFAAAFTVGPLLGATVVSRLVRHHSSLPTACAFVSAAFSVLSLLLASASVPETLEARLRSDSLASSLQTAKHLVSPLSLFNFDLLHGLDSEQKNNLKKVGITYFLYLFFYSGLEFNLTFLTHHRFGFNMMQQGKLLCFVGVLMSLLQGGFVRRLPPGREKFYCLAGFFLCIPAFLILGFASSIGSVYFALAIYAFPSAVVVPCLTAIASRYGDECGCQGALLGIFRSLGALARALGPVVFSASYWLLNSEISYTIGGLAFLVPALILRHVTVSQSSDKKGHLILKND